MKILAIIFTAILSFGAAACAGDPGNTGNVPLPKTTHPSPTAAPTAMPTPKNGDYPGKGVVTKIDNNLGSVELDHEEIVGVMPPMLMEFFVSEKALLKGLNLGDKIDFMLRYKDGSEIIVGIKKVQ